MILLRAPYDQCLSSRRFMLIREVKAPPRIWFINWMAASCGFARGTVRKPAKITDCGDPGRSTTYTCGPDVSATGARFFFGTSPRVQAANSFSSRGLISSSVVAPVMISVALLGLTQALWTPANCSQVMPETEASVPEPVSGEPYA